MNHLKEQIQYQFFSVSKDAWQAMREAMDKAKTSIYWETYTFIDDEVGIEFVDLLEKKAKEGVEVKLLIDGIGSYGFSNSSISRLKNAGVDLVIYNQVTLGKFIRFWRAFWERTHRKILVVDSNEGFLGGVNVQNFMADWLDLQLMVVGKLARSLTRAFAKSYIKAGGDKKNVLKLLHPKIEKSKKIKFLFQVPNAKRSRIRANFLRSINHAKKYLKLAVPYYLPDRKLIKAISRARKRGVKIDLILPFRTDLRIVNWTAIKYYELMDKIGVKLHFTSKMMHGKAFVVDGREAMVGSSNIDQGSFYRNREANAYISDKKMVGDVEKILNGWQEFSEPFAKYRWKNRGFFARIKRAFSELLSHWL
ncbi:MAG TPA: phosphatidylserine/phosphatidylglycerophosphate/cardiolipin synthase family protein [Candidatus Bipolaricaulota bacterium]|nr:phosphatidylserine/phosphatidylglycerophosphate/cardiolipin synthase family protein [Candidatus Bipolaricaulota bacterium]